MANRKISELPLISALSGSQVGGTVIPVVVGGTTAQISGENFSRFMNAYAAQTGSANTFTANQTINANLSVTGTTAIGGNTTIGGTLVVAGRLTAEEFHTEITTASVIYSSGSTKFGDTSNDTHEFTGSILIGGEVLGNAGLNVFSASFNAQLLRVQQATSSLQAQTASLLAFTASQDGRNLTLSQVTGSFRGEIGGLEAYSASLKAAAIVSSSTQVQNYDLFALNSNLYISTGSIKGEIAGIEQYTASLKAAAIVSSSTQIQNYDLFALNSNLYIATGSIKGEIAGLESYSASLKAAAIVSSSTQVQNYDLFALNSNLYNGTGSIKGEVAGIEAYTASLKSVSIISGSSQLPEIGGIEAYTASLKGQAIVSSSTQIQNYDLFALNSNLYNGTGSIKAEIAGIEAYTASLKGQAIVSSSTQVQNYDVFALNSNLYTSTGSIKGEIAGIESYTSSLKAAITVSGTNVQIIGDLNVNKLNVQYVSSSVLVTSGSNIFGDQSNDKHEFTGSVGVTGNLIGASNIQANKFVFTDGVVSQNVGGQNMIGTSGNILYLYTGTSGLYINNQANNAQNVTITDAGVVTTRGGVQIGSSGNDQNLVFGGTNSSIYWGVGGPARMYYNVGDIKISSNGASDVLTVKNIGGVEISGGITGSLMATNGVISGSVQLPEIAGIESYTASLKAAAIVSSSQQIQNYFTFARTGSANTFYGTQTISGSVLVSGSIIPNTNGSSFTSSFSLGSSTNAWGDIWVGNGSVKFVNPSSGATASIALDANNQLSLENSSFTKGLKVTGSLIVTGSLNVGGTDVTHYIGESYGGGIVFYVYDGGKHGLIAATSDQSTGTTWYNGGYAAANAPFDGINAGIRNTTSITTVYQTGSYAAEICAFYNGGNFGDWYLPSKYELNLLYQQKTIVGGFANETYWSSTELHPNNARASTQTFTNGVQNNHDKSSTFYVRAIRAF